MAFQRDFDVCGPTPHAPFCPVFPLPSEFKHITVFPLSLIELHAIFPHFEDPSSFYQIPSLCSYSDKNTHISNLTINIHI